MLLILVLLAELTILKKTLVKKKAQKYTFNKNVVLYFHKLSQEAKIDETTIL